LFAIVVSVVVNIPFLSILQITLLNFFLKAFPSILVLVAVHDFFKFISTHIRKLLNTKHLLWISKIKLKLTSVDRRPNLGLDISRLAQRIHNDGKEGYDSNNENSQKSYCFYDPTSPEFGLIAAKFVVLVVFEL